MKYNFIYGLPNRDFNYFYSNISYCICLNINSLIKIPVANVKYPEIDGLRGYLAFFVFIHHSYIWYNFLKTDIWEKPKSNLFNHLGETSVVFFYYYRIFVYFKNTR